MKNQEEAFLYIWYDKKLDMNYLGYHKGNPKDGYICSHVQPKDGSPWMLEEYKERPEDFTRTILAYGTAKECRKWEEIILTYFDAARSSEWYNKQNGGMNFVITHHPEEWKKRHSKRMSGEGNPMYGKQIPEISRKKHGEWVREHQSGENNPFYGMHHTKDTKKTISLTNSGRKHTEEWKKNKSIQTSAQNNPMYGKHHTKKTIENISKKVSASLIGNQRAKGKHKPWSEERHAKYKAKRKGIKTK